MAGDSSVCIAHRRAELLQLWLVEIADAGENTRVSATIQLSAVSTRTNGRLRARIGYC